MALWDGRFEGGPDRRMLEFGESLSTDLQMWEEDIEGSRAHVRVLHAAGLLSDEDRERLLDGLDRVADDLRSGWRPAIEHEDIHMAVEARLREHVGEVAGRLHTARSRNDQVATDVRLWLRRRLLALDARVAALVGVLLDRVERDGRAIVPGTTHLQRAQPIRLGHHLLAHAWELTRDRERIAGALDRVDRCPLGAAALAGTPHPVDRDLAAELLGFSRVLDNAMDAVAARDHLAEAAFAAAQLCVTLSRMAEELVLWSSPEFRRVRLSDAWSTGSSIMPQKRNPDAAELVRARSARAIGAVVHLLVLPRALPMAYNRDLQEDRPALFEAVRAALDATEVMAGVWSDLEFLEPPDLRGDFLLATELADFLAERGVPFREAHRVTGELVRLCERRGGDLSLLRPEDLAAAHPAFRGVEAEALARLDPEAAVERRRSRGGTAWAEIERQVALLRPTVSVSPLRAAP